MNPPYRAEKAVQNLKHRDPDRGGYSWYMFRSMGEGRPVCVHAIHLKPTWSRETKADEIRKARRKLRETIEHAKNIISRTDEFGMSRASRARTIQ